MAATPIVPSTNIKSLTVGSPNTPGKITVFNGVLDFVDGSSLSSGFKLKIDGANSRILIHDGTNNRVVIGKAVGRF